MLRLKRLHFFKFTLKQYLALKEKKQFRTILNASKDTKYQDLRVNFFQLIKEYHPDKSILNTNIKKGDCQEITKIITEAYASVTNEYIKNRAEGAGDEGKNREAETEEDRIYYEVFKKRKHEDPYAFYRPENEALKQAYLKKIQEMANKSSSQNTNHHHQEYYSGNSQENKQQKSHFPYMPYVIGATGLLGALFYYLYLPKHQQPQLEKITDHQIDAYQKKWRAKQMGRADNIISQYQSQQTPMLQWHPYGDVPLMDQLMKYTIFQDLEFFEVDPNVFETKQFEFSQNEAKVSRLDKMRPNTLITLSLEAERCLHNIYISKEHLLQELNTKGYFECPGVFFRFYGFIFFKLRPKKLNLENYKGEKWISLFDLYFKYYSPAYYYADYFDTHFTRQKSLELFGDVHFNTRTIPLYHLKPNQKNVYMWAPKGGDYKWNEEKYKKIWTNYYSYFVPLGAHELQ